MEVRVASRSCAELLRLVEEATRAQRGVELFRALARGAALALGVRYAFAAETMDEHSSRSLAYWEGADFGTDFSYRFPGTPCLRVAQGETCTTPRGLQELFPEDKWLGQIGADSYLGVPMKTAQGVVLGHLAVLHTEPWEFTSEQISLLQILAARGCAELERARAERALRDALDQVQRLKEQLQRENLYLQEEIRSDHNHDELVGHSAVHRELLQAIESIAGSEATVLISGETGTGKELVARALHDRSSRRERPLVKVNCGAISAGLIESELFGHVRGAFTGAVQKRIGRFELANGGTLFLDEIGELPLESQVKLLRVLQEQEFEPLGSSQTQRVDVRVIAATHRDLEQAIRDGRFRADLYYRLNVVPIRVPPLRERPDDIGQLAEHFLERSARKAGKPVHGIATSTLEQLARYDWPGNVRELENLIERGVVGSSGPMLELDPSWLSVRPRQPVLVAGGARQPAHNERRLATLDEVQRGHFLAVLIETGWVVEGARGAARMLGLTPSTLRSRMKKLGISRPGHREPAAGGGSPQHVVGPAATGGDADRSVQWAADES